MTKMLHFLALRFWSLAAVSCVQLRPRRLRVLSNRWMHNLDHGLRGRTSSVNFADSLAEVARPVRSMRRLG